MLYGKICVGCMYMGRKGGGGMVESKVNGVGSLKAGMLSRGIRLLGKGGFLKCLAVLPLAAPLFVSV